MGLEDLFSFCNVNSYMIVSYSLAVVSIVPTVFPLFDVANKLDELIGKKDYPLSLSREYEPRMLGNFRSD